MTARRRRKSGSGPSATALIAWVGGTRVGHDAPAGTSVPVREGSVEGNVSGPVRGGRAVLVGRACGLAAGTVLACGSVLVGATHAGDGLPASESAPLPNRVPTAPAAAADTPNLAATGYRGRPGNPSAQRMAPAPDSVSAQVVADQQPASQLGRGRVPRNAPASLTTPARTRAPGPAHQQPADTSSRSTGRAVPAPVKPVLEPATKRVDRVAPVGGLLGPGAPDQAQAGTPSPGWASNPPQEGAADSRAERPGPSALTTVAEPVNRVTAPVGKVTRSATQPAMSMLNSVVPLG